jgi:hypothetical protein
LSEHIRGGESLSNEITGERLGGDAQLSSDGSIVHLENVVRETSQKPCPIARSESLSHNPAHPSNRVITQLSAERRVVHDPRNPRGMPVTAAAVSFCRFAENSELTARAERQLSKRISLRQAQNMMGAVGFARRIGTPLNAHATIHWVGTKVSNGPDGRRFAKFREGFDKWLRRHSVPGGLTGVWVRERLSGGSARVVHCHMLFHLAHPFSRQEAPSGGRGIERLIDRHGNGNHYMLKLTFPRNTNGLYLVKGGGPDLWRRFRVPLWINRSASFLEGGVIPHRTSVRLPDLNKLTYSISLRQAHSDLATSYVSATRHRALHDLDLGHPLGHRHYIP